MNTIGSRLRIFMHSKYGSSHGCCTSFAKDLGIERETLSKFLNDKLTLSTRMQAKLRALGCDVEWLMTGKSPGESELQPEPQLEQLSYTAHDITLLDFIKIAFATNSNVTITFTPRS